MTIVLGKAYWALWLKTDGDCKGHRAARNNWEASAPASYRAAMAQRYKTKSEAELALQQLVPGIREHYTVIELHQLEERQGIFL